MSFFEPHNEGGLPIDLTSRSEVVQRFHRTLMDRRQEIDWTFDRTAYPAEMVEQARREWSDRAAAEYQSTAQFAQLIHRLTLLGAPIEMIGAATRLATDECRHAELCARLADAMGGCDTVVGEAGLSLYEDRELPMACLLTILAVCCFGETLSVPMFRALAVVTTDPLAARVTTIIANDEEYHSRFGWEALRWLVSELDDGQRSVVRQEVRLLMRHFERICRGGPDVYAALAGREFVVEEGEPNLGTLPSDGYASIFYATVEGTIIPGLDQLGLDGMGCWMQRT